MTLTSHRSDKSDALAVPDQTVASAARERLGKVLEVPQLVAGLLQRLKRLPTLQPRRADVRP